jgi:hypothetical protein
MRSNIGRREGIIIKKALTLKEPLEPRTRSRNFSTYKA